MPDNDNLTMTFTRKEWRIIAAALTKVKPSALIGISHADLQSLASRIATETGKSKKISVD